MRGGCGDLLVRGWWVEKINMFKVMLLKVSSVMMICSVVEVWEL